MFLLDTDVVWELRHARRLDPERGLAAWAAAQPREQLFLSALVLLELDEAAKRGRDKTAQARLARWLDEQVLPAFEGRVLPVDAAVVRRRRTVPLTDGRDALLAATALERGMTLATREPARFRAAKVRTLDPWAYQPADDLDWRQAVREPGPHWLKNLFVRGSAG